jgi:putative ABC transport system permease protein
MTLLGGITGIAVGGAISYGISYFGKWETVVTPFSIFLAFFFSLLVGVVFGIYPARKASFMDPIEALRYE